MPLRPFLIPSVWRSRFAFSAMYACGCMRRRRGIRKHTGHIVSSPVVLSVPAVLPSARSDWQGVRRGHITLTDKQADSGRGLVSLPPPLVVLSVRFLGRFYFAVIPNISSIYGFPLDLCSSCVSHQMASLCAYSAWYIFPRWKRPRAPLGPPLGRLIYGNTVSSCSPLISRSAPVARFSFPLILFSHMRPLCVSFVVSLAVSPCVSSHAFRCRCPSCRPSCRLIGSSRLVVSYGRRFVLLFARSRLVCRGVIALRSRAASFLIGIPFVPRLARRLVVASRPSSRLAHLVFVLLSRSRSPVGCSCSFSFLFSCSHRSILLVARSCSLIYPGPSVSVVVERAMRHGGLCWFALLVSLVPSRFYSLFTRLAADRNAGGWGYEAPFHTARRSFIAIHAPSFFSSHWLISSRRLVAFPSPRPQSKQEEANGDGESETGTRQTRRYDETTRQDAQRDENEKRGRHENKQATRRRNETRYTRRRTRRPLTKSERQTTTVMGSCRFF